jgi:flagellar biosynthesis protein FlhG
MYRGARAERSSTLGIVSGKGGVGKSTLAVNLATACASRGESTLLVDGDAGLANADLLLGLIPRYDLGDWCAGRVDLAEVLTPGPGGLDLLVSGAGRDAAEQLVEAVRGGGREELESLVSAHRQTILDLGAGIGDGVLELAELCDPVWLVVAPEPTSLADAYTLARQLWERSPDLRIEVVVNRSPDAEAGERTFRALSRLVLRFVGQDLRLRGVLPEDPAMQRSVSRQEPVVLSEPRTRVARRLELLAESLLEDAAVG